MEIDMAESPSSPSVVTYRVAQATLAQKRGWLLTPLRGKKAVLAGWQKRPAPSMREVLTWAFEGNVGLRTGTSSGLVVIDVDTAKGADLAALLLPPTITVVTGSGGRHLYFRHPGGRVFNSVGRLAPHVDVRGDGGQVVFVGSIHPETGRIYRWVEGCSPEDLPLADLPVWVLTAFAQHSRRHSEDLANIAISIPIPVTPRCGASRYGQAALANQMTVLRSAAAGVRNDTLYRAACDLGRLVARGCLLEEEVRLHLTWAAQACGLPLMEASRTIQSGLRAGQTRGRS